MAFRQQMPKHDAEQRATEYHRENEQRDQQVVHGYLRPPGKLGRGDNSQASIIDVDQALQPIGCHIHAVCSMGSVHPAVNNHTPPRHDHRAPRHHRAACADAACAIDAAGAYNSACLHRAQCDEAACQK
jgi:hypothetical protein